MAAYTVTSQQQALEYFVSRGWTSAQSAGIVANLIAESRLNPAAIGDGGAAYGIAQWHPDRQEGFQRLFGRAIQGSSLDDQLAWVDVELRTTESAAGNALRACTTASEAGACVSEKYERPADRVGEAARRATLAKSLIQQPAAPIEDSSTTLPPQQPESSMPILALLTAFGPIIASLIPQVSKLFNPNPSEVAGRNLGAAQIVLDTIVKATGSSNVQAAVEAMTNDPAQVAAATKAIVNDPAIMQLLEVGGGIAEARKAAADPNQIPFYKNPGFLIAIILAPLIYMVVYKTMWDSSFSEQLKTVVVTAILSGLLGSLTGFYFGSSLSSARKDDALANR